MVRFYCGHPAHTNGDVDLTGEVLAEFGVATADELVFVVRFDWLENKARTLFSSDPPADFWQAVTGRSTAESAGRRVAIVGGSAEIESPYGLYAASQVADTLQDLGSVPSIPIPEGYLELPGDQLVFLQSPGGVRRLIDDRRFVVCLPSGDDDVHGIYNVGAVVQAVSRLETEDGVTAALSGLPQAVMPGDFGRRLPESPWAVVVTCPVPVNTSTHDRLFSGVGTSIPDSMRGVHPSGRMAQLETYASEELAPDKLFKSLDERINYVLGAETAFAFLLGAAGWLTGSFSRLVLNEPGWFIPALLALGGSWTLAVWAKVTGLGTTLNLNDVETLRQEVNESVGRRRTMVHWSVALFGVALLLAILPSVFLAWKTSPEFGPVAIETASSEELPSTVTIKSSVQFLPQGETAFLEILGQASQSAEPEVLARFAANADENGEVAFEQSAVFPVGVFDRALAQVWFGDVRPANCHRYRRSSMPPGCAVLDLPILAQPQPSIDLDVENGRLTGEIIIEGLQSGESRDVVLAATVDGETRNLLHTQIVGDESGSATLPVGMQLPTVGLEKIVAAVGKSVDDCVTNVLGCLIIELFESPAEPPSSSLSWANGRITGTIEYPKGAEDSIHVQVSGFSSSEAQQGDLLFSAEVAPGVTETVTVSIDVPAPNTMYGWVVITAGETAPVACTPQDLQPNCWLILIPRE